MAEVIDGKVGELSYFEFIIRKTGSSVLVGGPVFLRVSTGKIGEFKG